MFARAVVMELAGRVLGTGEAFVLILVPRHMDPAAQIALGHAKPAQPRLHRLRVDRAARMARAGQRKLRLTQTRRIGGTTFQERQRLKHLAR